MTIINKYYNEYLKFVAYHDIDFQIEYLVKINP